MSNSIVRIRTNFCMQYTNFAIVFVCVYHSSAIEKCHLLLYKEKVKRNLQGKAKFNMDGWNYCKKIAMTLFM